MLFELDVYLRALHCPSAIQQPESCKCYSVLVLLYMPLRIISSARYESFDWISFPNDPQCWLVVWAEQSAARELLGFVQGTHTSKPPLLHQILYFAF
jgi:hypothetical protein